jgi:hypothetical protein
MPPGMPPDAPVRKRLRRRSSPGSTGRAAARPRPVGAVHRLNRTEYNNALRDLLALDLDETALAW